MFVYHKNCLKKDIGTGIRFQNLGKARQMNVWHWNMEDGSVVSMHTHTSEQFGYVISGGFEMVIGDERGVLQAGDAYFIPSNIPHEFKARGETEAIDVFSPVRPDKDIPGQ